MALTFLLYKPVRKFLNKRTEKIQGQLSNAEEQQSRANELKALYEKKLGQLEEERIDVLETAHEQAAEKRRQMLAEAKKEVTVMKEQAETVIQERRERADQDLRLYIIDTAAALAEKIVAKSIDGETQNKLFDQMMEGLEDTTWNG